MQNLNPTLPTVLATNPILKGTALHVAEQLENPKLLMKEVDLSSVLKPRFLNQYLLCTADSMQRFCNQRDRFFDPPCTKPIDYFR